MAWTDEQLNDIYDRTSGYCHICRKKLAWNNYARRGEKGNWEVEHSVPRACGGSDRMNNLYAACIDCNRSKRDRSTRSCRASFGRSRAPLGRAARQAVRTENAWIGGALGAFVGLVGGPVGVLVGAATGAHIGQKQKVD